MSTIRPSQSPTIAPTQQPQQTDVVKRPATPSSKAAQKPGSLSLPAAQKSAGSDKLLGKVNSGSLNVNEAGSNERTAGTTAAKPLPAMTAAEKANINKLSFDLASALDGNISNNYSDATYARQNAASLKLDTAIGAYYKRAGLKPGSKEYQTALDKAYYSQLIAGTKNRIAQVAPFVAKAKTAKDKAAIQRRLTEMGKWLQSYRNRLGSIK